MAAPFIYMYPPQRAEKYSLYKTSIAQVKSICHKNVCNNVKIARRPKTAHKKARFLPGEHNFSCIPACQVFIKIWILPAQALFFMVLPLLLFPEFTLSGSVSL